MAGKHIDSNRIDYDMDENEDDDFGSDGWDEMDDEDNKMTIDCFFCNNTFSNIDAAVFHSCKVHGFDLSKLKAKHKMDCYSYIKLVNYIRSTHASCITVMICDQPLWHDDSYLVPVNREDPWLMFDFDDVEEPPIPSGCGELPKTGYHVNAEDGRVTLSEMHFAELQRTIQTLNAQIREKDELMSRLVADIQQMKATLGEVVVGEASSGGVYLNQNVADIRLEDDEEYFNTYAHFGIHHEMLSDEVRTVSYQEALLGNSASLQNLTVLDLGCGTGILSMFAARAGAGRVIGIDQSDIIYHAMDIIRENELSDKITLIKGRLEDTELPIQKVDVIVSEWMGYFLLFEAMLDSVIFARDKHLKPGGLVLPNRCSLSLVGASDHEMHGEMLGFWSNVYGFKMSSLRNDVAREPRTCIVSPEKIVTSAAELCLFDLMTVTTECMDFEAGFQIISTKESELTALVGYFDVFFDLPNPVSFSTSPLCKPTHWKQTVFLLPSPIPIKQGELVQGKLECRRNRKEIRSLIVTITLGNLKQRYLLS